MKGEGKTSKKIEKEDVPMKVDYRYVETKSKHVHLLLQPAVYKKAKAAAGRRCLSFNAYVHELLENAND